VRFLNHLRHRADGAPFKISASDARLPAAVAVRDQTPGRMNGIDYRGVPVLAVWRPIAGTRWHIVAKIDHEEVMQPLRRLAVWIGAVALFAVIVISFVLWLLWRQQRQAQGLELAARTAAAMRRQKDLYDVLSQTNQAIVRCNDRDSLFDRICQIAAKHGDVRFASICLAGEANDEMPARHFSHHSNDVDPAGLWLSALRDARCQALCSAAMHTGQYAISNDFLADAALAEWHEPARQAGVRAVGSFPFRRAGRVIGTLNLYAGVVDFFEGDILNTVREMTTDISFALDNLDRNAALEAASSLVEASPVVLFRWLPEPGWPVAYVSENVSRWGYAAADFRSGKIQYEGVIHPDDRARVGAEVERFTHEGESEYAQTYRIFTGGGETLWVEDRTKIIRDEDGRVLRYEGLVFDVTERVRLDTELKRRQALIETLLEHAPVGFALNRISDGRFVFVSEKFETLYGVPPRSLHEIGTFFDTVYVDPAYRDEIRARVMADIESSDRARMHWDDVEIAARDGGEPRYVSAANIPLPEQDLMISAVWDVTERHQASARMREQLNELQRWHEATVGRETRVVDLKHEINQVLAQIGLPPRYPAAETEPETDALPNANEHAHADPQHALEDAERSRRALLSVLEDQRHADEELYAAEEQFRGLVEQSIAGIYIIQDERFVYVNQRFADILGYAQADDLVGREALSVVTETSRATTAETMRQLLERETTHAALDLTARRRDGSPVELGAHASRATHRGRPAIIGLMQDISEKKRTEERIAGYIEKLEGSILRTVEVITILSEMRDPYTTGHEKRVAEIAVAIGTELGFDEHRLEGLRIGGYLHDVGKIIVPTEILSKPGRLSTLEYEMIKGHPQAGYDILKKVEFPWPVAEMALQHHERIDGSGYPQGLEGEDILLEARILAIADVVESIASHRPYRPKRGIEEALAEIEQGRERLYDPEIADACLRAFRERGFRLDEDTD
jgi:PAS domain S-box-containing protein/putative nucleotidyltransferase with HDIG domain